MTAVSPIARSEWTLWGIEASIVVTEPQSLLSARLIVDEYLNRIELACSRFRDDSEIRLIENARGIPVEVSSTLARLLRTALDGARITEGSVDPTIGAAMVALGYDRDFALIEGREVPIRTSFVSNPQWSSVRLDGQTVTVPAGVQLDLGATAKALAADDCAEAVSAKLNCGVLVCLGGDIATAGPSPDGGWTVLVQDGDDAPASNVVLPPGVAVATSSTRKRRWSQNGRNVHHIIDPYSGRSADATWQTVTVAANSCVSANLASTACVVRGFTGARELEIEGLPARLVGSSGEIRLLNGWPSDREIVNAREGL
ncbi:FAD:protein FMN transferase [Rhodococcus sp. IEGM 1379]|uniref:FAD:protein FMN transferase n=1 Tax=Rhodococcus sp. IEGM 1379 TaxID=3047086 RepID=UPI0032D5A604